MDGSATKRVLLLGKTGVGKSSLANTIFGETIFQVSQLNGSKGHCTRAETRSIYGGSLTLIDAPGFFDAGRSEEEIEPEIVRCNTECAPGPHAFLIVLKVEKFTEHEQAVITKILEYFSEDALKYAAVVFTHGDQLPEGMKIEEYVCQSEGLRDLLKRCGGRCHVVDNKYWKTEEDDPYRSNEFHVAELVNTIDKLVTENAGGYYTNEMLHKVEKAIQDEAERIKKSSGNLSEEEIRKQAQSNVFKTMTEKSQPWIRGLMGFAVIAGILAAVVAVWLHYKVESGVTEATLVEEIAPITTVVEVISEEVKPSAEDFIPLVEKIPEIAEKIPEIAEKIPEIAEKIQEIAEKIPEIAEKIPEIAEKTPGIDEKIPEIAEKIPGIVEQILERCKALFEKIYDPWNNFE